MKRACTATTKNGQPCRSAPLKHRDTCISHLPQHEKDKTGFGINGGRPPKPRMVDLIRQRMEADLDAWYQVLTDARQADRAIAPNGTIEYVPDHPTRLAALKEACDRAYGKPKQTAELSGPDGGPVRLGLAELAELARTDP